MKDNRKTRKLIKIRTKNAWRRELQRMVWGGYIKSFKINSYRNDMIDYTVEHHIIDFIQCVDVFAVLDP